ncbi:unnamed protein product [Closterium sp. Naga37s-1]|nr:unnamed protein product [Closterium sp. Naga37s-1]
MSACSHILPSANPSWRKDLPPLAPVAEEQAPETAPHRNISLLAGSGRFVSSDSQALLPVAMEGLLSACLLQPRALALGVSPCLPRSSSRHPRTRLRSATVPTAISGAGAARLGSKWLGSRSISAARNLAPGTIVSCPAPVVLPRGVARPVVVATAGQTPKAVSGDAVVADSSESAPSTSSHAREVTHFYRHPLLSDAATQSLLHKIQEKVCADVISIRTEQCFNVELTSPLDAAHEAALVWVLSETYEPEKLTRESVFSAGAAAEGGEEAEEEGEEVVVEVGPRLSFTTAWSTNAVSICRSCTLEQVTRIERSRRYALQLAPGVEADAAFTEEQRAAFTALVHDRMTECVYESRLETFVTDAAPAPVVRIPVMKEGRKALEQVNKEMGLAFDEWDLDYYTRLFREDIGRDPTNVELFDIAQSNSEHSRHWFFKGDLTVDGQKVEHTLMDLVKDTLTANPNNSVIGFKDNSSAIRGRVVSAILPENPGQPSKLAPEERDYDILFTAETHNFPCAVAPFPGAETGAGGRIRDTHATGVGSLVVAATAGYCVGNLQMEGHAAPWEDTSFVYPPNLAPPLQILLDASDGASDYGNKFGEPLIQGYTRTFGMRLASGERREWLKPIMFSGGIGQIDHRHLVKEEPDVGMLVVKIGGPAYRIGMGGGAASSMVSGTRDAEMDFNAVQRGDAEMAQKLNRVVRTCVELGDKNPILSIHDQGAGGNCNVVKEIIYPQGAEIDVRSIVVGDETMSVLEIWGAEYQEQDALLARPESEALLRSICKRERLSMAVIGTISGSGKVVLFDSREQQEAAAAGHAPPLPAVDLDLDKVLGDMPSKRFDFVRGTDEREPLELPPALTVAEALKRVLRLPSVASKRFLTTKVDRCVTGLVAQQQTVGPLQITLADVAVIAQTHTGITGAACAIGEQPIKGLINPAAMARMAIGEALTNLVWAKVTALEDVKASGNWMYAAKMGGEGAAMYDAAVALKEAMLELGIAVDGGKDSLSMAATAGGETVMAPGNLVLSAYVTCPDITLTVTPDLKLPGEGVLIHVDLSGGSRRVGGSALAHVYDQIGDESPDADVALLKRGFNAVQDLIGRRLVSSGHDVSDGGIITAILEMAFAGNTGVTVDLPSPAADTQEGEEEEEVDVFGALFAEELGLVIEVAPANQDEVLRTLSAAQVPATVIGQVTSPSSSAPASPPLLSVAVAGVPVLEGESMPAWRDVWEESSFLLEQMQRTETCAVAEMEGLKHRKEPSWKLPFTPSRTAHELMTATTKPKVAVLREEGSNGDREMAAAVWAAGMEPWDVTVSDLLQGRARLDEFRGIIFVGGFSYADVLDSAKGWAAAIRFNAGLKAQFDAFYQREDTWSLGVCNGCQLMALLGWVPGPDVGGVMGEGGDAAQPRFVHNESGRFECRFSTVQIEESPAVMLRGMEGTRVGIWVAHGEGRALFPSESLFQSVLSSNLAPIRYCDDDGAPTEAYPFNPNGSPAGIAALCSPNGRHLAMMPHPERCYLMWQLPWAPKEWREGMDASGPSPWLKLFQNAREWCAEHPQGYLEMMPHPERCYLMFQLPWAPKEWSEGMDASGPSQWQKNTREWCAEHPQEAQTWGMESREGGCSAVLWRAESRDETSAVQSRAGSRDEQKADTCSHEQ